MVPNLQYPPSKPSAAVLHYVVSNLNYPQPPPKPITAVTQEQYPIVDGESSGAPIPAESPKQPIILRPPPSLAVVPDLQYTLSKPSALVANEKPSELTRGAQPNPFADNQTHQPPPKEKEAQKINQTSQMFTKISRKIKLGTHTQN